MNQAVVRSRWWCLVLAVLVGWLTLGISQAVSIAQDNFNQPSLIGDGIGQPGFDGKRLDARNLPEPFLNIMVRESGIFGFLILLVSFALIAVIMMIAAELRRDNYLPSSFIEEFERQLQAKDYQGAYELAKTSDSFIGRVLAAGMGRLSRGYDEAVEQMQQVGEDQTMTMEHKIGYLALIAQLAPMLGLLGTVQGMVLSFRVISNSVTSPRPAELAHGIMTALFTTLEGLVVAIPAIVFYSLYRNRLARFLMESGFVADNLMRNFQGIGKPTATGPRPSFTSTSPSTAPAPVSASRE